MNASILPNAARGEDYALAYTLPADTPYEAEDLVGLTATLILWPVGRPSIESVKVESPFAMHPEAAPVEDPTATPARADLSLTGAQTTGLTGIYEYSIVLSVPSGSDDERRMVQWGTLRVLPGRVS